MAAVILFTVLTVLIRNISPVSLQTSSHCRCLSGGFNNLDSLRLNERLLSVSEHAYISSSIYRSDFDIRLYWSRPSVPTLFRPSCTRFSSNMLVASCCYQVATLNATLDRPGHPHVSEPLRVRLIWAA